MRSWIIPPVDRGRLGFLNWYGHVEGNPSILVGIAAWFHLADKPDEANWLTESEKNMVRSELERDQKAMGHREHSVLASLKNGKLWLLVVIYFGIVASNATLNFCGPSIVKEIGRRGLAW
ncbi:MAG: MFS transporter, partial [Noviherbaspirillum sp.]